MEFPNTNSDIASVLFIKQEGDLWRPSVIWQLIYACIYVTVYTINFLRIFGYAITPLKYIEPLPVYKRRMPRVTI